MERVGEEDLHGASSGADNAALRADVPSSLRAWLATFAAISSANCARISPRTHHQTPPYPSAAAIPITAVAGRKSWRTIHGTTWLPSATPDHSR